MQETIRYNKVDPVIQWAQTFITVPTIKFTFSFIKKLRISGSLVWRTYFIKHQQSIVKYLWQVSKKVHSKRIFTLSLILILILKSFVNMGPEEWFWIQNNQKCIFLTILCRARKLIKIYTRPAYRGYRQKQEKCITDIKEEFLAPKTFNISTCPACKTTLQGGRQDKWILTYKQVEILQLFCHFLILIQSIQKIPVLKDMTGKN